jgi:hypothetical protein
MVGVDGQQLELAVLVEHLSANRIRAWRSAREPCSGDRRPGDRYPQGTMSRHTPLAAARIARRP